ncbi:MAG: hypothetical protein QM820_59420 [Minicystis sp.]
MRRRVAALLLALASCRMPDVVPATPIAPPPPAPVPSTAPPATASAAPVSPIRPIVLPIAENVDELIDAPTVALTGQTLLVDGVPAGSTREIEEDGRLHKIDDEFMALKAKREAWKGANPDKPFPGIVLLRFDEEPPAVVVKCVFQTAAFAGFPNIGFVVQGVPKPGEAARLARLDADAQVPGPPSSIPPTPATVKAENVLHLRVGEDAFDLVWKQGARVVSESRIPMTAVETDMESGSRLVRYPDLVRELEAGWKQHGQHRAPADQKLDQATVYSDNRAPFRRLVAAIDAIRTPKRALVLDRRTWMTPVFNVTFAIR